MLFLFLLLGTPCLPLPQFHFKPSYLPRASPLPYPYPSLYSSPFNAPFSSHFFSSPRSSLLASPKALCSSCSCSTSFGCSYNCDKCPALCKTCSCTSSLGCHYNCDKCQKSQTQAQAGGGGEPGSGLLFPLPGGALSPPDNTVTGGELVLEQEEQAGQGGVGQVEHIPQTQPSTATDECKELVSKDLCQWGPSCPTMLAQLPQNLKDCNYNCTTCILGPLVQSVVAEEDGDAGDDEDYDVAPGVTPATAAQEAEEQEDYDVAPQTSPVPETAANVADIDNVVAVIDGGSVWGLIDNANKDESDIAPPQFGGPNPNFPITSAVEAEEEGSSDEAENQAENVENLGESGWSGFQARPSCLAVGGPAKGKTCQFPFTHDGATYHGCAYKPGGSRAPVPPGSLGWCSTRTDINGYHINGLNNKYVGFCDNSCPSA